MVDITDGKTVLSNEEGGRVAMDLQLQINRNHSIWVL